MAAIAVLALVVTTALILSPWSGTDDARPRAASGSEPRERAAAGSAAAGSRMGHIRSLQRIADRNGGNRAAGTPGDRASVAYVAGRLREAGYDVTLQRLGFPFFDERGDPRVRVGDEGVTGIETLEYSDGGRAAGPMREIDPRNRGETGEREAGCVAADFAGLRRGEVALIERGTCRLRRKVDNAAQAGASAAIVFNDGRPGREDTIRGTLGSPGADIPAVFASYEAGRRLAAAAGRTVSITVRAESERRTTTNVIADSAGRRAGGVVMAGAHLDSVADGPGINDNASGVAALLDSAESLAALPKAGRRPLRFAFWGAEELGLIGSRRYVDRLAQAEREQISMYLNLDMVGSRNSGRFLYASDDAGAVAGSARRALRRNRVPVETTDLGGGSDHASFQRVGIPVAGLFSGAADVKSDEQRRRWGGRDGVAFDRCYHRACDTADGIDRRSLRELGTATTDTLRALARR